MYISQLIRIARVCSHVDDLIARNKCLAAKLLKQGYLLMNVFFALKGSKLFIIMYRYHKIIKAFSKFYRRHHELVSKFNVGFKILFYQCLSGPEFYGDFVYKFKKIWVGLIFLISFES